MRYRRDSPDRTRRDRENTRYRNSRDREYRNQQGRKIDRGQKTRFKLERTRCKSDEQLVPSDSSRHCDVMGVALPSQRDLTVSVQVQLNGYHMKAVVDSAREDFFKSVLQPEDFAPVCVFSGIGTDPVNGRLVHNVPISVYIYSLPLIEDCLDSLHGKKLFCILDPTETSYHVNTHVDLCRNSSL